MTDIERILATASDRLLGEKTEAGHWTGELSTSALSTATAVMALRMAVRSDDTTLPPARLHDLIVGGLDWLQIHQNEDGGWGDTTKSFSNISTTMLCNAVFQACVADRIVEPNADFDVIIERSSEYLANAGGVDAVIERYGKDHTFSVPILTHCALAGIVDWKRVMPLPFELACVPAKWYAAVRMPVVSYALPALIAIGQVIFHHRSHWNPVLRWIRRRAKAPSMRILESIQPENGGFLEATPLTSFVCMSLLASGYRGHRVTQRCLSFIDDSVRQDGSWPIDTNLSTWVTTLSINALAGSRSGEAVSEKLSHTERQQLREWLIGQQYRNVHPYTNSPPGGWAWTDLPGGVPDADDTPGAMLAIMNLRRSGEQFTAEEQDSLSAAANWLLNLQNRDGGWPTFCRGWGTLPFDRSSNDLTAHVIRAFTRYLEITSSDFPARDRIERSLESGFRYLQSQQSEAGAWLPLWFGNQHHKGDENPLYGTAKVVLALREATGAPSGCLSSGIQWLIGNQNEDGSWSGHRGLPGSVEETALAVEALSGVAEASKNVENGVAWLAERVSDGTFTDPSPIGFYFAKLWYFERLYPIIFTTAALQRYLHQSRDRSSDESN